MKVLHPNGVKTLVLISGTEIMGDIETSANAEYSPWATIAYLGSESRIVVDKSEWPAFMELIKEMNEVMLSINNIPK